VVGVLAGYLEESSIPRWLSGVNAHLDDRRPASVLRRGSASEVFAAIEALTTGGFACKRDWLAQRVRHPRVGPSPISPLLRCETS
jgi:hypothetical protein